MQKDGLARVEEIYLDRGKVARELHDQGKKVIAYICCYVPLELMTALDIVPYRVMGDVNEPITEADVHMETIVCPFVRSAFDIALKGALSFCDGLVIPHTCDSIAKTFNIWEYNIKPDYFHFLDVPHKVDASSLAFFKSLLGVFAKSLEDFTGKSLSSKNLAQAIKLHNENRALMRELYDLRKEDPTLICGSEMTRVLVASMSIPVSECNGLLRTIISEVKERGDKPKHQPIRLLVYGAEVDDTALIDLIEESGANVVMDDLCIGSKSFWPDVLETPDPLDGIVERYLDKINCARTYRPRSGTYEEYQESRFGYIRDFASDFKANGVILYILRCCDPLGFDAPEIKDYLEREGFPVLYLEDDYAASSTAGLRTRVQAFLETLG
ncbi:MAG: 2-hydroxyacyl-CoA dehydratase family protein [Chloroflexota bacterium]|nr:2-hydroxyacyl-CoA dehydratase family protein [Chloroflexota bacterium]